jgi:predicted ATPase
LVLLDLELSTFKCFSSLSLSLRPLTLLAGVNGGGKSTVLQALVLLHQALADTGVSGAKRHDLPLNGSLLTLGSVSDVVDKSRGGRTFSITVSLGNTRVAWRFQGLREALAAKLVRTTWSRRDGTPNGGRALFPGQLLRTEAGKSIYQMLANARYVPADRLGPSEVYPLLEPDRHRTLGPRAERAVGALFWGSMGDEKVAKELRHPDPKYLARIDRQAGAWLNDLFPGVVLEVQRVTDVQGVPTANLVTLRVRTNDATDFHRPQNVGFGITYALPILVALLSSAPGDLVLLENPEAHLHARAQVRVAELCVRAAQAGIQVIVETHSDHVLNGVRVAVHRGKVSPESIGIHFFDRPSADGSPSWRELRLGPGGRLAERPDGFFDEVDRQLSALLAPADGNG